MEYNPEISLCLNRRLDTLHVTYDRLSMEIDDVIELIGKVPLNHFHRDMKNRHSERDYELIKLSDDKPGSYWTPTNKKRNVSQVYDNVIDLEFASSDDESDLKPPKKRSRLMKKI
jgi:hypothetical protein